MHCWHDDTHDLRTLTALRALYPEPQRPAAAATLDKECDHIHPLYQRFIEAAPWCVLATRNAGSGALDLSPRGDGRANGGAERLVEVVDAGRTLLLPDRRGNNRIDSLRNLAADSAIGLLFLIPGVGEAIRVQGRARISAQPQLCERFAAGDKLPRSVLVIAVHKVFFQCARAAQRGGLWDPAAQVARSSLPSTGSLIAAFSAGFDAAGYDGALQERQRQTLY
ncbi:MSMEG_1061 family FMN-dependent PPOX-type flavoprotein [Inhella proteolytica]|uniref:Pyridoxamine 5'-phosphate oxidase family protein n=1 Tax=Inhella proteolytica TaxID=2795029 RepID=A0A931NGC3_9BURK|nr:MSMEG_1061 family FMN-dependent PPOX-type flavoprotein [Inhella proteolytica]MBH9577006.1 pyridoxamine 5'-phosphate oxidase family protein [Inhella proteolytica]